MKKIAIQGYSGSFHEIAAHQLYGETDLEILPCRTFAEVFTAVESNLTQAGLVAIENSQAGSILSNYRLLRESGLCIAGEYKLRIEHNLLALPGQDITAIQEVHSHTMALQQCRDFFKLHSHIRLVNSDDTAYSAYEIKKNKIYGRGAIGSSASAQQYELEILAANIETNTRNFTRFLIICQPESDCFAWNPDVLINKASLVLKLAHSKGSLARLLTHFAKHDLNLTKIQSLPLLGQEWNYLFYIDLVFDAAADYRSALSSLHEYAAEYHILGEYSAFDSGSDADNRNKANSSVLTTELHD